MNRYPLTDALSVHRLQETESALKSLQESLPRGLALTDYDAQAKDEDIMPIQTTLVSWPELLAPVRV